LFKTGGATTVKVTRMNIKLSTINLEVSDPEASKQFYVNALGMTLNPKRSHSRDFLYLESAGCHLTLARRDPPDGQKPCRSVELGFEVDDLPAVQKQFASQNINGFKPQKMGWGEVIEGCDPDGHRVILYRLDQQG